MEAITFSPAQLHVFNLVSHIKTAMGLEKLREQLAAFYAKQVDNGMNRSSKSFVAHISELPIRSKNLVTLDEFLETRLIK